MLNPNLPTATVRALYATGYDVECVADIAGGWKLSPGEISKSDREAREAAHRAEEEQFWLECDRREEEFDAIRYAETRQRRLHLLQLFGGEQGLARAEQRVQIINICDVLGTIEGSVGHHVSYEETNQIVREWCAMHNVTYYASCREHFNYMDAVWKALMEGTYKVLVEDLS